MQKRFRKKYQAEKIVHLILTIVAITVAFIAYSNSTFVEWKMYEMQKDLTTAETHLIGTEKTIDSLTAQLGILHESIEPDKNKMEQVQIGARLIRKANSRISTRKSIELAKIVYDVCEYSSSIDYAYALSVISVESKFNPIAVSDAGAIGLGQLMPATAASLAQQLGLKFENDMLLDPKYNMTLSIKYMSNLRKDFNNAKFATAAYNGGPGGALKYMDYVNGKIEADSVHPETLAYVNSVMKVYSEYAASLK